MRDYYFDQDTFVIENYNTKKTFANFLPGIAGMMGIPLWVFYVNRAQGISGFGLQDKNHPIMPFTPANKAYETVAFDGFRTFIKNGHDVYEPFKTDSPYPHSMRINASSFTIEETNTDWGITLRITYFGLVEAPLAGLVRSVELINQTDEAMSLELLDGIAEILPAGIQNEAFKSVSNVLASWIDVNHFDQKLAFFRLRGSTGDSSEVTQVKEGNFYVAFDTEGRITPIVDKQLVFGQNTAKTTPSHFVNQPLSSIVKAPQFFANKIPCAFVPKELTLKAQQSYQLFAMSGHTQSIDVLTAFVDSYADMTVMKEKQRRAQSIIDDLLEDVSTKTAQPIFDAYVKQNYLDNILRGGYPLKLGPSVFHIYSRRHGDLERDYNFFSLAPEYYSQGNGNFRDVCQNRRMDSFIHPEVERFNIHQFASLLQLDGYNPLSINGIDYRIDDDHAIEGLIKTHFKGETEGLKGLLKNVFTPGRLVNYIERHNIDVLTDTTTYLEAVMTKATPSINATFGEGFWTDHFTYILDLIESYEAIYPDKMSQLLFDDEDYAYFDAPVTVKPRHQKYVLNAEGKVRQYGSLRHFDQEKMDALGMHPHQPNWATLGSSIYHSNLYTKLLILTLNKHSCLDPDGLGIEMEAEKPGWNDAMNGLPGLIGSGVSESIELLRIVDFLLNHTPEAKIILPREVFTLYHELKSSSSYHARQDAKERYRQAIRLGLGGEVETLKPNLIIEYLNSLKNHLETQLTDLLKEHHGLLPTFLYYEAKTYEPLNDKHGVPLKSAQGYPHVEILDYERKALPVFLEAPARLLKTELSKTAFSEVVKAVSDSAIYDKRLNMYKTSAPLQDESHEIGRIHAFTPGWLERESNFLHMSYKYLLGLLRGELYDTFYETIKSNLVCFMDPEVYGRSTLENSSFIAPSNNPNPMIHGQGFFARLSGSTVETLNMWAIMMTGGQPFKYENDTLVLRFAPKLHKDFFTTEHQVTFKFLKNIEVTYINEQHQNTYDRCAIHTIQLINDQETKTIHDAIITGELALAVREGHYKTIHIYMNA